MPGDDYQSDFLPQDVFQVDPMFMCADPAVERLGRRPTGKVLAGVLIAADVDHVGDSGPSGRKWTALTAAERQWPCAPG